MLATLIDAPFDDEEWIFETKWDGYRILAYVSKGKVKLVSRGGKVFNEIMSPLVSELEKVDAEVILDGEAVILDGNGRSDFQLMQNYQTTKKGALYYTIFDLLFLDGEDLRQLPLIERKKRLQEFLDEYSFSRVRYSDHVDTNGKGLFKEASKHMLEGIIGKRKDSIYVSKRSRDWVKIKTHLEQEVIICGFTAPQGSRQFFGALILGVYENGRLAFAGHVGTGFDENTLKEVYAKLKKRVQAKSPFAEKIPRSNAVVTWVKPELVCQISLSEWTHEWIARHPVFKGLRLDKEAKEVKREKSEPMKKNNENKAFSNPEKIYFPEDKITKADLLQYYQKMGPIILPYLKNKPLTLKRYPDGIDGQIFYQKDSSKLHLPSWMKTTVIHHEDKDVQYLMVQNQKSLEYVINLGSIELHPFLSNYKRLEHPDYFVIDLDPENIDFKYVMETALAVHDVLEELRLPNFCKTSGGRGIHILIPTQGKYTFEQVKQFGQIIALIVHKKIPKITSLERKPAKRQKKVYLDVYQNNLGQTIVSPYSVRGKPHAPVSTPLKWSELKGNLKPTDFTIENVPERVRKMGDILDGMLKEKADLKKALQSLSP